jgi:lipopolysaccharide heptosyltransferase I
MPECILLVRLGSLGDIIHSLPVAATLRASFPHARIDWLVDARQRAILDLVPVIDRLISVDPSVRGFFDAIRNLRTHQYDVAIDLQGLWKSAILTRGSGAARVIGFPSAHLREPGAQWCYSETSTVVSGPHVIQKNLSLLRALGVDSTKFVVTFPFEIPASGVLAEVYRRLRLGDGDQFVLLNPGAAWPNKRWPPERFGRVSAAIATRHHLPSAVVWGPGEESLAERVVASSDGSAVSTPKTSIGDLLALARAARLMISGDTGPLHIAAAVGTSIVALFGPTDPARNGPWSAEDVCVSKYRDCSCHYQRRCHRGAACLLDLDPDEVLCAVDQRLALSPAHVQARGRSVSSGRA